MRYALISDIHANLPALEAVLADIARRASIDATYHLGDLVGYAPWPNETIGRLRAAGIPGVAGNYDSTVATGYKHCGCRYEDARQEELSHLSFAWTLQHTSDETKAFLGSLPFRIDLRPLGGHASGPTVTLLHGLVLARSVFEHSANYESVVALGRFRAIKGEDERLTALAAFTNKLLPSRWSEVRGPSEKELKGTTILAMDVEDAAAKIRSGPPDDDDSEEPPAHRGILVQTLPFRIAPRATRRCIGATP